MLLPVIGITLSVGQYEKGPYKDQSLFTLNSHYIQAVVASGAIPVILPVVAEENLLERQLQLIDGLILSGGEDIHPSFYGETPQAALGKTTPERDLFELALARQAHRLHMPILGICRGLQLLNVAFGGTLYQDIPSQLAIHSHCPIEGPKKTAHPINIAADSQLRKIFLTDKIIVNSLHHQAVKDMAPGFIGNAYGDDGLVEGIEIAAKDSFVVGVQWHPEQMIDEDQKVMSSLFNAFISECKQWKTKRNG